MKKDLFDYPPLTRPPVLIRGDEGYDLNEARELYIERMKDEGKSILLPEDNELLIDIDSEQHYETFLRSMECISRNWDDAHAIQIEEWPSKSGLPRRHIIVSLPFTVDPWKRIALQACFGSDPMREILSVTRMLAGDPHPTLFVEELKRRR